MFLHLSHDEKFIDAAHDAFERAAPGRHEFVVVDAPAALQYIKTFEPRRMPLETLLHRDFTTRLPAYDAVFLHSLNKPNRLIVDAAPADTRFVWLGWGFDYYGLIRAAGELWLPKTRALMQSMHDGKKARSIAALAKAAVASPRRIRTALRSRRLGPGGSEEYALLQKIQFFAPVLSTEDALIRERHPDFKPRFASWNYGAHDIVDPVAAPASRRAHRVIVGNSATPECNHLEAFDALADFDGEIVVPLSYGNPAYRDAILHAGRTRLGERFRPLTEYMAAEAYARLIAGSSHVVMNHLRQQGFTNVLIALQAGTRVAMQRANPLFPYLAGIGLPVDDIADPLASATLSDGDIARQRKAVSAVFGAQNHHRRTSALLEQVDRSREPACIP